MIFYFLWKNNLTSHIYLSPLRFDQEIEDWGVDVDGLKEPAISHAFVGWTEDREKDEWRTNGAVKNSCFLTSIKLCFVLPDIGHVCYIHK